MWLSPVDASPQDDNGDNISDYRSIDPRHGTLGDGDVVLTVVANLGSSPLPPSLRERVRDEALLENLGRPDDVAVLRPWEARVLSDRR